MEAHEWIDRQYNNYDRLVLKDNTITHNQEHLNAEAFGSVRLSSQMNVFSVQLTTIDRLIGVGVIDEQYKLKK